MKVYGMEMIVNEVGEVRRLYDEESGKLYTIWEKCKYGGLDRIYSCKPKTLRNKMYKNEIVLREVG